VILTAAQKASCDYENCSERRKTAMPGYDAMYTGENQTITTNSFFKEAKRNFTINFLFHTLA
jgi:hypothetical protein